MLILLIHESFKIPNLFTRQQVMLSLEILRSFPTEWLTSEILDLIKERNRYKLNGNMDAYRTLRNKVSALIAISKKETYQSKIEKGKSDPRTIWKIFKEFGMNNKERQNASKFSLKLDDKIITNESDLSEIFNNYFINTASKLKKPIVETDFEPLNNYVSSKVPTDIYFEIPLTNHTFIRHFYQI